MTIIIDKPAELERNAHVTKWLNDLRNTPDSKAIGEKFDSLEDLMRGKARLWYRLKRAGINSQYRMTERKVNNQYILYIYKKL